jgi:hypothetical protein
MNRVIVILNNGMPDKTYIVDVKEVKSKFMYYINKYAVPDTLSKLAIEYSIEEGYILLPKTNYELFIMTPED